MELPEGWNRFSKAETPTKKDQDKASELLKEFSEALCSKGTCIKFLVNNADCKACLIYKKFKEWK